MNPDGSCEQPAPPVARLFSPWRPGVPLPESPLDCVSLGAFQVVHADARGGVGLPLTSWLHVENDGTLPATQALLTVEPERGRVAPLDVPGPCSGGSPLVCRPLFPPRSITRLKLELRSPAAGSVRTVLTLTSPDQREGQVQVAEMRSEVVRCTLAGTPRADVLRGSGGPDRICARHGNDRIAARGGDDWIDAGPGDDRIFAGPGRDTVLAGSGRDIVHARDGERDVIRCGSGRDLVYADRAELVARDCERVLRR